MSQDKPFFLDDLGAGPSGDKPLFCVHGLNQRPEALIPLLEKFKTYGHHPYLMRMPGHEGVKDFFGLNSKKFEDYFCQSYQYISSKHSVEPNYLGYSFGGLLGPLFYEQFPLNKMILLAPALKVRAYAHLVRLAFPFLKKIHSYPFSDRDYEFRYRLHHDGVPIEIYKSFFSLYLGFLKKDKNYLKGSRALVWGHKKDELIQFKGLKSWVGSQTLWDFKELSNEQLKVKIYNHLCFDETTLGKESYNNFIKECQSFLN